ncbi:hypothetical protein ANN_11863 [Periplaneta americana]|uniref:Reverse transcriptase domain-containing protein n=1 Tax=Periplaneta americana TaxID=6978 RepID=A0ABQ8T676_PERAM|nr:hypothetical protein ANN_11863 [Periplaneta americana]
MSRKDWCEIGEANNLISKVNGLEDDKSKKQEPKPGKQHARKVSVIPPWRSAELIDPNPIEERGRGETGVGEKEMKTIYNKISSSSELLDKIQGKKYEQRFCDEEKTTSLFLPLSKTTERVAAVVKLNKETISRIRKEGKECEDKGVEISTPNKVRRPPANKVELDDMDKCIIRREVHKYYRFYKGLPTLGKLHKFLRGFDEELFSEHGRGESRRKKNKFIRFADDMALLAEEETIRRDMLLELNDSCEQYGKKINANKTKTMVVARKTKKVNLRILNEAIEQVDSFKYSDVL